METAVYISALILGLGSSLHCLGMCGPLVLAVPFQQDGGRYFKMFLYLLGKAVAYAALGSILGLLGLGFYMIEWQQAVSIIAGVLVVGVALFPILKIKSSSNALHSTITDWYIRAMKQKKWYSYAVLGFLNGLLPCGMVYLALTTAVAAGHPLNGAVAMLIFGIGTMPVLFLTMVLRNRISLKLRQSLKPITIGLSLCVGILMILRGLNLGIPMISPHYDLQAQTVEGCCH